MIHSSQCGCSVSVLFSGCTGFMTGDRCSVCTIFQIVQDIVRCGKSISYHLYSASWSYNTALFAITRLIMGLNSFQKKDKVGASPQRPRACLRRPTRGRVWGWHMAFSLGGVRTVLFYSTFGQNGTVRTKPFYPRLEDIKNILLLMIIYRPMYVCMISVDTHIYIDS